METETTESGDVDRNPALRLLLLNRDKYLNFLLRRLPDREMATEILQRAALKIMERGAQLRLESRAEAWLYRVLRTTLADHFRENAKSVRTIDTENLEMAAASPVARPCACAMQELSRLKPEYAEALRAVEMEGTPVLTYAKFHGISPNAASVRLHRARKSLRQRILNTCGSCAGAGCFDCSC